MRIVGSAMLALSIALAADSAFAQGNEPATQFFGNVCEIDTTPLNVAYLTSDGTRSVFTFQSRKLCTGAASARNVKLECSATLDGWTEGDRSASGFVCTINGDQCGLTPKAGDPNAPYLTATQSSLTVSTTGVAELLCFYKP